MDVYCVCVCLCVFVCMLMCVYMCACVNWCVRVVPAHACVCAYELFLQCLSVVGNALLVSGCNCTGDLVAVDRSSNREPRCVTYRIDSTHK